MSKTEIIKDLAERMYGDPTQEQIKTCENFCNAFTDMIIDSLIYGKEIKWKGIFTMKVVDVPPRKGRNPSTNKVVEFPATKKVVCKLSRNLKHMISGK